MIKRNGQFRIAALLPLFLSLACSNSGGGKGTYNPRNPLGLGPAPVNLSSSGTSLNPADLGSAGNYVILAQTGISSVPNSVITGNIGVSPAAATYITGFSLSADSTTVFATSPQVTGKVYAANYGTPTPANMTSAIGSMQTAYTDAAGRTTPDFTELSTGNLGGLTMAPGLYNWSNTVTIPLDFTLSGGANDVWIFQIAGDVTMAAGKKMILAGGAQAKNIYWQVAGKVDIGSTAQIQGIMLVKTAVNFQANSTLNGRIFSQTAVSLNQATVTQQ